MSKAQLEKQKEYLYTEQCPRCESYKISENVHKGKIEGKCFRCQCEWEAR